MNLNPEVLFHQISLASISVKAMSNELSDIKGRLASLEGAITPTMQACRDYLKAIKLLYFKDKFPGVINKKIIDIFADNETRDILDSNGFKDICDFMGAGFFDIEKIFPKPIKFAEFRQAFLVHGFLIADDSEERIKFDLSRESKKLDRVDLLSPLHSNINFLLFKEIFGEPERDDWIQGIVTATTEQWENFRRIALESITPREAGVLNKRFTFQKGTSKLNTLKSIGESIGVQQERIRQILSKTFRKLRHPTRHIPLLASLRAEEIETIVENL